MAIDSEDKRASAGGFFGLTIMPKGDGTINAADRLQVAGLYRGFAAAAPTAVVSGPFWTQAAEVFTAGASAGEIYIAGVVAGDVFVAGATKGEVRY